MGRPADPFALSQRFPFCWWVAFVIDQYSRHVVGFAVFEKQPTSIEVRAFLGRAIEAAGARPKYLVSDLGVQFDCQDFRTWCDKRGIRPRYASKDSIRATAVVERLIKSIKTEWTRRITVSLHRDRFRAQIATYLHWYHDERPHMGLGGKTPSEVYAAVPPANECPRFEPRPRWPRRSRCAQPNAPLKSNQGEPIELVVRFADRERVLPIVELRPAA